MVSVFEQAKKSRQLKKQKLDEENAAKLEASNRAQDIQRGNVLTGKLEGEETAPPSKKAGDITGLAAGDIAKFGVRTPEQAKAVQEGTNILGARERAKAQGLTGAEQAGSQQISTVAEAQARQGQLLEALNAPLPTQEFQPSNVDFGQAVQAGLATAAPAAVGGAVAGLATGGIASVPLAAIGAVGGFLTAFRSNLKSQIGADIDIAAGDLISRRRIIKTLLTDMNKNPQNSLGDVALIRKELSLMQRDYNKLKFETKKDINKFLGENGKGVISDYETFFAEELPLYNLRLNQAIVSPNPNLSFIEADEFQQ